MEEYFNAKAKDGITIHGIRNVAPQKTNKCIVIVHGFMGTPREWLHQSVAHSFTKTLVTMFTAFAFTIGLKARGIW